MKTALALLAALALTACASDKDYQTYIAAQQHANTQAAADQKPLVRLTAQPGQNITGLASLEVFTPQAAPVIQQARPNEWVGVINTGLAVTGTVLGIHAGGIAAGRLADSVGRAGTAGYQHVQAPGAVTNTTNTMTGSTGTLGSGSYDATHTPTVVVQPAPAQIPAGEVVVVNPVVVDPAVVNPVVVNPVVVQP